MLKSIVVLFIIIIAVSVFGKDDDKTDCDGNPVILNGTSGQLKINGTVDGKKGKTCEWIIDGTASKGENMFVAFDENLILSINDSLEITNEDKDKKSLFQSKGFQWPGVIILEGKKKIRVTLILTNDTLVRNWDVLYGTDQTSMSIQNIESTGRFVFPLNKDADLKSDFTIALKSKSSDNKLLLNVESLDLNGGTVNFSKVVKYNNQLISDKTIPDFLLSNDQQINIVVSKFSKAKDNINGLQLHYDLVNSNCSQYTNISDIDKPNATVDLKFPSKEALQSLSSYRCLNIFEHQNPSAKLLFDLREFNFKNTGDFMTVLDGNSRNSSTLAIIESHYLNDYWKNLYLYSSANKMWIMFESPQVINKDFDTYVAGIQALSQGGSFHLNSTANTTEFEINDKTKPFTPLVFTYTTDLDKQILIDFDNTKKLIGNDGQNLIDIYESTGRNGQPFVRMISGDFPPDIMASNTNELKLVVNQIVNFKAEVKTVNRGCHSTYLGTSGASFIQSGPCNGLCSWLIPKKDNSSGTYILQFSHLNLLKDSDQLMIERLGNTSSTVLDLKGPLTTTTFPDLILDSNQTYVLYMRRQCGKDSPNNSQLIGVSLVYVDHDLTTHEENVEINKTIDLMTSNYPNYYSVGSDHLWRISESPVNQTVKALLTFNDLNLSLNHKLILWSKDFNLDVNTTKLSDLSDNLVTLPFFMNLTSDSIDAKNQPFSGRGFTAKLMTVGCGDNVIVVAGQDMNITTPTNLTGISKCIWTVYTKNTNDTSISLLEFDLDDKDVEKNLKIYDSKSIRGNKLLNYTYFNTTRKLSSTNYLVIEYNIETKNPKPLHLTLKQAVCSEKCVNTKRCLLTEFYCNGIDDCGDYSDERCNGSKPLPPAPTPEPLPNVITHSGVNGWVVTLVICPLMIGFGVLGTLFGPRLLTRVGRGRYREFQDFSEVS